MHSCVEAVIGFNFEHYVFEVFEVYLLGVWLMTMYFIGINWLVIIKNWYKCDNTASFGQQFLLKSLIVI